MEEFMKVLYTNVGKKIKGFAKVMLIIESLAAFFGGIALMTEDDDLAPVGLLIMFVGPVVLWVLSWFVYAFGELVDKASDIERNTHGDITKSRAQAATDNVRIEKLESLRAQGLISEAEYQQAVLKNMQGE